MRRLVFSLLAATLAAAPAARAAVDPVRGKNDPRIRSTPYDPEQIVRLTATALVPIQVLYEAGEHPVTITGPLVALDPKEAKDWFAVKSGNALILQPLHVMQPSVLFVRSVTATGEERHYTYLLGTRDGDVTGGNDPDAYVEVDYTYKHTPTPDEIAEAKARRELAVAAAAEQRARVRLAQAQLAGTRNYLYDKRDPVGCPDLAPLQVWDDGHQTKLLFAPHAVLPNLYAVNADGKETIVTTIAETTVEGVQVTAPSTYREMRLRRGAKVCALRNDAYDPVGTPPGGGTGTISPDVVRTVRAAP